jgi:hypothetical protein
MEGFGIGSVGGRGGVVLRVTNLNEEGPGSFAAALDTAGPRHIVFEVGGVIRLRRNIYVRRPFVSIWGQTAPSPGVTLYGGALVLSAHDVVMQHLRVRAGDDRDGPPPQIRDALSIERHPEGSAEVFDIVVDHCSFSWGMDETVALWDTGVRDVTIRRSLIAESLDRTFYGPDHSKGLLVGDNVQRVAIIQNVLAHNDDRNPVLKGNSSTLMVNNLVYDYGRWPVGVTDPEGVGPTLASVMNNIFVRGPSSPLDHPTVLLEHLSAGTSLYFRDNRSFDESPNPADFTFAPGLSINPWVSAPPVSVTPLTVLPTDGLEQALLTDVGALPRDAVDTRIIGTIRDRTGRIIDSVSDVGGPPSPAPTIRPLIAVPAQTPNAPMNQYDPIERWVHSLSTTGGGLTAVDTGYRRATRWFAPGACAESKTSRK